MDDVLIVHGARLTNGHANIIPFAIQRVIQHAVEGNIACGRGIHCRRPVVGHEDVTHGAAARQVEITEVVVGGWHQLLKIHADINMNVRVNSRIYVGCIGCVVRRGIGRVVVGIVPRSIGRVVVGSVTVVVDIAIGVQVAIGITVRVAVCVAILIAIGRLVEVAVAVEIAVGIPIPVAIEIDALIVAGLGLVLVLALTLALALQLALTLALKLALALKAEHEMLFTTHDVAPILLGISWPPLFYQVACRRCVVSDFE
ncbi:hypothetical protein [Roseovarius bejariae]|uniref:hypothetical protein n=1 Tax=Roseovarius bejariae TaxID=2576383 RepID=UPI001FE50515|nr:hypothetical protein [Roseovarius bejariae]